MPRTFWFQWLDNSWILKFHKQGTELASHCYSNNCRSLRKSYSRRNNITLFFRRIDWSRLCCPILFFAQHKAIYRCTYRWLHSHSTLYKEAHLLVEQKCKIDQSWVFGSAYSKFSNVIWKIDWYKGLTQILGNKFGHFNLFHASLDCVLYSTFNSCSLFGQNA